MRPGFINSFRPSFRTPLGGGLELLGFVERSRPMPVVAFFEGRIDEFMASEPVWQGDLAQTGDHMRGFIVPIYPPAVVSNLGLMRHANGGVRLGVDDGINYWMRWNNGPAVPTLAFSFAASTTTAIDRYGDNADNANFGLSPYTFAGQTVSPLAFDCATDKQSMLMVGANNLNGSGVWGRNIGSGTNNVLIIQDTRQRRCVSVFAPMAVNFGLRTWGFVGGSEGGTAFVERFNRTGTVSLSWSFVDRLPVSGTQVDQILVLGDDTGSGSGRLLLSQPDGLRSYTFATPGGALTLEWFVPGSDGFGIEQNIDGTLIWGKGAELVALTRQGVVEQVMPLPGSSPRAGKIAVSPWGVGAQGRVFVGGVSGNGLGTTGYLYNLLTSPRSRFLPINNSLYIPMTEPVFTYANVSPNQYAEPNFFGSQEGDTYRLDNCVPGVRFLETTTRIYNVSGDSGASPWLTPSGSYPGTGSVSFFYTAEGAAVANASAGALPNIWSIGNTAINVRRGILTGVDDEDRLRLVMGAGAGMPNGQGQWSFPITPGVEYNITLTWDILNNYIGWFIDGVLVGQMSVWTAANGVTVTNTNNLGRAGSGLTPSGPVDVGGRVRAPLVGWARRLSPSEVVAFYDRFKDVPVPLSTPLATGGDSVFDVTIGGQDYRVHVFLNDGVLNVQEGGAVEMLLVGGGGGGGWSSNVVPFNGPGGGGGGGVVTNVGRRPFPLVPGNYPVVVGLGGAGGVRPVNNSATNGQPTSFAGIVAAGGGRGASSGGTTFGTYENRGCGGGTSSSVGLASRYGHQGRGGGNFSSNTGVQGGGGGGGGAERGGDGSGAGGGSGGLGLLSDITGTPTRYAGGGGGGTSGSVGGFGGLGGGGAGGGVAGTDGLGGGGGAGVRFVLDGIGGDGGSGIVIVRYPLP